MFSQQPSGKRHFRALRGFVCALTLVSPGAYAQVESIVSAYPDVMRWQSRDLTWCYDSTSAPAPFQAPEHVRHVIRAAMSIWEQASRLRFHEAPAADCEDGTARLIQIKWESLSVTTVRGTTVRAMTRKRFSSEPIVESAGRFHPITGALVRLNTDGYSGQTNSGLGAIDQQDRLIRVIAHELGHALGFNHRSDPEALMAEFSNDEFLPSLSPEEVELLHEKYGAPDTTAPIGAAAPGVL